jgi:hypothetical protein
MCAQDGWDNGHSEQEGESMIFMPKEVMPQKDPAEKELEQSSPQEELPRTTTGVIRIMRARGRPEMAALVEELHSAEKSVIETTKRAEDLLKLLRTLHRKATGTYPTVKPRKPAGDDI